MEDQRLSAATTVPPIVALAEELDVTNSGRAYADLISACVPGAGTVIADLRQTTFCDSSGVRALFQAHNLAVSQGLELSLVVTHDAVLRVLDLSGLASTLRLYPSLDAAIAACRDLDG